MNKIVVANLKNNLSTGDIDKYLNIIDKKINSSNVIICPTSIYLPYFLKHNFQVGAQDIYYENDNCTGEVTPKQYKSFGVTCSLIGHSERRSIFNETNDDVIRKFDSCIKNNIIPILCIEGSNDFNFIDKQISFLKGRNLENVVIAYEPVWSIGTGYTPSSDNIKKSHLHIKNELSESVKNVKVLYGGSVNMSNIKEICSIDEVDGVLIGSASCDVSTLISMYNKLNKM